MTWRIVWLALGLVAVAEGAALVALRFAAPFGWSLVVLGLVLAAASLRWRRT